MGVKISPHIHFSFDDVLIRPMRSFIEPREVSLATTIAGGFSVPTPYLSAAMYRVTDARFAIALARAGGVGVLHRNCTLAEEVHMVRVCKKAGVNVGAACGPFDAARAEALVKAGADLLVVDCAHGHNMKVVAAARVIKKRIGKVPLVVGNIVTSEAVRDLRGVADAVKVGVGPGSICTTRLVSGVGVPQLSAIIEVAPIAHGLNMRVIADGGMRSSSDIAKALAAGANAVMLGNLFAGAREAPGKVIVRGGKKYKEYRGMGSRSVLRERHSSDRYFADGRKLAPEGIEGYVPCVGSVADVVGELVSGVQVAFGYVGAKDISTFQKKARFLRVTESVQYESAPHSLVFS